MCQNYGIIIHGGAGNIRELPANVEKEYKRVLEDAVLAGYSILEDGGSALDAVEAAVKVLEDSPMFNAGRGSVLNRDGYVEMDASIMDGKTMKAGAVAGVQKIKNPITAARKVMELTPHVLLVGENADIWAKQIGLETKSKDYFITKSRKEAWIHYNKKGEILLDHEAEKYGTVGAVALDRNGNVAAATSTGGLFNKLPGRVGDTPIIGAGTYANNDFGAVSCTGVGEFFMRYLIAFQVINEMNCNNKSLKSAVDSVINFLSQKDGRGGIIAIDKNGNVYSNFNTTGMFRAYKTNNTEIVVKIYK